MHHSITLAGFLFLANVALGNNVVPGSEGRSQGPFGELTYERARALALERDQLVLIAFYGADCEPCDALDRDVFSDEGVRTWLAENAVALRTPEEPRLAARYAIGSRPTILLLTTDEVELERVDWVPGPDEFIELLEAAAVSFATSQRLAEARDLVDRGRELAATGKLAEALHDFLRAFDLTREEPTWDEARLGGLLGEIAALLPSLPEARSALAERRDRALATVLGAHEQPAAHDEVVLCAREVAALNRFLKEPQGTRKAWNVLRAREGASPQIAAALFDETLQLHLLAEGLYEEFIAGIGGDPFAVFDRRFTQLQEIAAQAEHDRRLLSRLLSERNRLVNLAARCYQALLGLGEEKRATDVAELVLVLQPTAQSYLALMRSAETVDRPQLARELFQRGMAVLDPKEMRTLRSLSKRAPGEH